MKEENNKNVELKNNDENLVENEILSEEEQKKLKVSIYNSFLFFFCYNVILFNVCIVTYLNYSDSIITIQKKILNKTLITLTVHTLIGNPTGVPSVCFHRGGGARRNETQGLDVPAQKLFLILQS